MHDRATQAGAPLGASADQALAAELARRCGHHWTLVQAVSRRGDVRRKRVKLLLLLHRRACPLSAHQPRRSWYVPGAVVAAGVEDLQLWWRELYDEDAPSDRALRSHLSTLERAGAIVRSPGEIVEGVGGWDHPPPRLPDTLHLVVTRREAQWWARIGRELLEATPKARHHARTWWRIFAKWRTQAADAQLEFEFDELEERDPSRDERPEAAVALDKAASELERAAVSTDPLELLSGCRAAGASLRGAAPFRLVRDPTRLAYAMRALAGELRRRRRVRNRAGWLVWVFDYGPGRL